MHMQMNTHFNVKKANKKANIFGWIIARTTFFVLGFSENEQGGTLMYDKMKLVGRDSARPKPIIKNANLVSS
jgi:hypothetical protein